MTSQQPHDDVRRAKPPRNGSAVTSLALGLVAIVTGVWTPMPVLGVFAAIIAFVPAVFAVVFGYVGLTRAREIGGVGRGTALAGLWTGYITLAIIAVTTVGWIAIAVAGAG